jgi:hypothetical protein
VPIFDFSTPALSFSRRRWLSPRMLTVMEWCSGRSRIAVAQGSPPDTQCRQKDGWISTNSVKTSRRPAIMQMDSVSFTAAGRWAKLS